MAFLNYTYMTKSINNSKVRCVSKKKKCIMIQHYGVPK